MLLPQGFKANTVDLLGLKEKLIFHPNCPGFPGQKQGTAALSQSKRSAGTAALTNGKWMLIGPSLWLTKRDVKKDLVCFYDVLKAAFINAGVVGVQGPWHRRAGQVFSGDDVKFNFDQLCEPLDALGDGIFYELDPQNASVDFFVEANTPPFVFFRCAASVAKKTGLTMKSSSSKREGISPVRLQLAWVCWIKSVGCRIWARKGASGFDPVILSGPNAVNVVGMIMPLRPDIE